MLFQLATSIAITAIMAPMARITGKPTVAKVAMIPGSAAKAPDINPGMAINARPIIAGIPIAAVFTVDSPFFIPPSKVVTVVIGLRSAFIEAPR